jgi:hypothetical protein
MKTDELIDMLSTNLEPAKSGQFRKVLAFTVVAGGLAAFCVMLATVGLRTDASGGFHPVYLALKLLFMLTLIGVGAALLARLICPGQDGRSLYTVIFLTFLAVGLAGVVTLVVRPSAAWGRMILGTQWAMCSFCIPLFAIPPFAALIWALRRGAPTNLKRAGAVAGLVAGALGAVAYAFHCPDDSIPFIALWYGAMVGLCALMGALFGPRLLRW